MAQTQGFMTALYERLSRDDELNGESQSEKASGAVRSEERRVGKECRL